MDYHYDKNIFRKLTRSRRQVWIVSIIAFIIFLIILYIIYDGLSAQTTITESREPEQTLGAKDEQKVFNEPTYRLTTDITWERVTDSDTLYDHKVYHSVVDGLVKRALTIYVNDTPPVFPVTHVMPVEVVEGEIRAFKISPKCDLLQPTKGNKRDVLLSWGGSDFLCDPDLKSYIVAASHNLSGYNVKVPGELTNASYFFVYRDFELAPSSQKFEQLLRDFEAK